MITFQTTMQDPAQIPEPVEMMEISEECFPSEAYTTFLLNVVRITFQELNNIQ